MKKRILVWSDWVLAGTGFGVVSKHVLHALQSSGLYEIDQLAINYNGEFFDRNLYPYQTTAARLQNPKDPYGNQMFANAVATGQYDYLWIMNDTFVVENIAKQLPDLFSKMSQAKMKIPKIVYYCPVDLKVIDTAKSMLQVADRVVAYCNFGKDEILKALPEIENKLSIITHGTDLQAFTKINTVDRKAARLQLFNIRDDQTFVWMNTNRNSPRKDIPKTILAFSEFRKRVPNSKLYLHTAIKDTTIDLGECVKDLNLSVKTDVIFPGKYASHKPYAQEVLNILYNACDGFMTTTLGEGWGLTHLDAALLDIPIVCPNNTVFPEQMDNGNRGYMYACDDLIWVDNSGFRKTGRVHSIVDAMEQCYLDVKSGAALSKINSAREYARSIDWNKIGKQWIKLFEELSTKQNVKPPPTGELL